MFDYKQTLSSRGEETIVLQSFSANRTRSKETSNTEMERSNIATETVGSSGSINFIDSSSEAASISYFYSSLLTATDDFTSANN